ncbi:MAG: phospho-N-acetylmuramoyl-pentapeptide-transferase, partial [Thermodesulfovibrionales bacterium]
MLYLILYGLHDYFSPLNVFRYITVRTALAVMTAAIIVLVVGPRVIAWLRLISVTQQIRTDGPGTHLSKKGTPTMGGVLIHLAIIIAVLLWGDLSNRYVWMMILSVAGFGLIGFVDDYRKVSGRNTKGMRPRYKLGLQVLLAVSISSFLQYTAADPY